MQNSFKTFIHKADELAIAQKLQTFAIAQKL